MYFQALDSVDISWFFFFFAYVFSRVCSKQPKQQRKREEMNLLKVQATEESLLHSISLYFPDPSAKLTISLDLNLFLD